MAVKMVLTVLPYACKIKISISLISLMLIFILQYSFVHHLLRARISQVKVMLFCCCKPVFLKNAAKENRVKIRVRFLG